MSKIILKLKKLQRSTLDWVKAINPRVNYLIDRYQIIKVGCVLGTIINGYLIYDGAMSILVLRNVKKEVDMKKDLFYRRVENKKEQILALMEELEQENLLSTLYENKVAPM